MSYLIYVNGLGPNFRGDNLYEFIFSDEKDVWGENWDSKPSNGYPQPPDLKYVKKVGVLKNTDIKLDLISLDIPPKRTIFRLFAFDAGSP